MDKNEYLNYFEEFENDLDFKTEYKILEITEDICKIMDKKSLNRADLARLLDTSKSAVTKMLSGSTNFTLKRLIKIAMSLEKDVNISFNDPIGKVDFNAPFSGLKDKTSNENVFFGIDQHFQGSDEDKKNEQSNQAA